MRRRRSRTFAVVTCLLTLWSSLLLATPASAQQQPGQKAGTVTTLKGQATLARANLRRALNFRDDVNFRDQVSTERDAVVRVLLGGKAVVTIRELSDVTITEEPNRSVVKMSYGRLALQVLSRLLQPGETVEVQTPNAVAAVRGSTLIVDVPRDPASPKSTFAALDVKDPVVNPIRFFPSADPSKISTLPPDQTVDVLGEGIRTVVSQLRILTPTERIGHLRTLDAPRPPDPKNGQGPIATRGMGEATVLANLASGQVVGTDGGFSGLLGILRDRPTNTGDLGVNEPAAEFAALARGNVPIENPPVPPLRVPISVLGGFPVTSPGSPGIINNGGFESGLMGWTVANQIGGSGNFFSQSGTTSPSSSSSVPGPPEGSKSAMTDQGGPGAHFLFQDVTVSSAVPFLRFRLFIGNRAGAFITRSNLDYRNPLSGVLNSNQQARVDIVNPSSDIAATGFIVPQRNLFQTRPGDPLVSGYDALVFDLSQYAGQSVGLLFSEVDNQSFFQLGVDDVLFDSVAATALVYVDDTSVATSNPLLTGTGETRSSTSMLVEIDASLVAATAPLLNLLAGSRFTSAEDALRIVGQSNVTASGSEVIRLDASHVRVLNGDLTRLAGQSRLTATGDFLHMRNGATLIISNGTLLGVTGESSASIAGAFVRFGGTGGNVISVSNNLAPTGFFNGIPVHVAGGGSVTVTNPTPLPGLNTLGTIRINGTALPTGATAASGITGSLIDVRAGGTVKIGP